MSREDIVDRLYKSDFEYEDFFDGSSCRAALEVITPSQDVKASSSEHEMSARIIYEALFGESDDGFYGSWKYFENCILISFLDNYIVIYFPDYINKYQYDKLAFLFNKLEMIDNDFEVIVNFSEDKLSFFDILVYMGDKISDDTPELNFEKILR